MSEKLIVDAMIIVPVLIYKLGILLVGYFTIKMGFVLLREGVKGEFRLKADLAGYKGDLASISPGTLFVVMGAILLAVSILSKSEYNLPVNLMDKGNAVRASTTSLPKHLPEGFNDDQ